MGVPSYGPGPGSYDEKGCTIAEAAARARMRTAPDLTANQWMTPRQLPKGWTDKGVSEATLMRQCADVLAESKPERNSGPGPGQYDPKPEAAAGGLGQSLGQTCFGTGESVSFRVGNSHMARKYRPVGPGPGNYETPPSPSKSKACAAASFASNSKRFDVGEPEAPGPAYYGPVRLPPKDKDFHLN